MILSERDKKILICAVQHLVLRPSHIQGFYRGRWAERDARRRAEDLEAAGYLVRVDSPTPEVRLLFKATKLGRSCAVANGAPELPIPSRLYRETIAHDILVTSVRLRIQPYWDCEFVSEQEIKKSGTRLVPDGIFRFKSGREIALEVENSEKSRTRFLDLARRWRAAAQTGFVLYVACNKRLSDRLKVYLKHLPEDRYLGVLDWPTLKAAEPTKPPKVWTVSGEIPLFEKREY